MADREVSRLAEAPMPLSPAIDASLVVSSVVLPWSGRRFAIVHPGAIDSLLDLVADDPEQNLPYWAEVWPSGIALADVIVSEPFAGAGPAAIELGCGVGVTAIAAIQAGFALIVTDYAPEALTLCVRNCQSNGVRPPAACQLNWRDPRSVQAALAGRRFDVVLAADVLYERRDIVPLLDLVPRLIRSSGTFLLAEPGRPPAAEFLAQAAARGWRRNSSRHPGPWPDPADRAVVVRIHRFQIPPAPFRSAGSDRSPD